MTEELCLLLRDGVYFTATSTTSDEPKELHFLVSIWLEGTTHEDSNLAGVVFIQNELYNEVLLGVVLRSCFLELYTYKMSCILTKKKKVVHRRCGI